MKKVTRKCFICKNEIDLEKDGDSYIYYKTKYYHIDCFIKQKMNQRRNPWTREQCDKVIDQCILEQKDKIDKQADKDKLVYWLYEKYDITYLPTYFFMKLDEIMSGTYKQVKCAIPAADLLDMWQQKEHYLDKVALRNEMNGKSMSKISRINYDLAILLGKYDSYLEWKEKKQAEIQAINAENADHINYSAINNTPVSAAKKDKISDLSEILDEI